MSEEITLDKLLEPPEFEQRAEQFIEEVTSIKDKHPDVFIHAYRGDLLIINAVQKAINEGGGSLGPPEPEAIEFAQALVDETDKETAQSANAEVILRSPKKNTGLLDQVVVRVTNLATTYGGQEEDHLLRRLENEEEIEYVLSFTFGQKQDEQKAS